MGIWVIRVWVNQVKMTEKWSQIQEKWDLVWVSGGVRVTRVLLYYPSSSYRGSTVFIYLLSSVIPFDLSYTLPKVFFWVITWKINWSFTSVFEDSFPWFFDWPCTLLLDLTNCLSNFLEISRESCEKSINNDNECNSRLTLERIESHHGSGKKMANNPACWILDWDLKDIMNTVIFCVMIAD